MYADDFREGFAARVFAIAPLTQNRRFAIIPTVRGEKSLAYFLFPRLGAGRTASTQVDL